MTGILAMVALFGINLIEILSFNNNFNPLNLAIIGSLIPFLYFNLIKSKNKIFLGDSGSLFLGYTVAFLLLYETRDPIKYITTICVMDCSNSNL